MTRSLLCFFALLLVTGDVNAADLKSLLREYTSKKREVKGGPDKRAEIVKEEIRPLLEQIGSQGPEALPFLLREMDTSVAEIAAACPSAILKIKDDKAPFAVVAKFARRPRAVQSGILRALAHTQHDLQPVGGQLIKHLRSTSDGGVRELFPEVLAKVDSVAAAKAMVSAAQSSGRKDSGKYSAAVIAALQKTKNDNVREWLSGPAFSTRSADGLLIAATLAGKLKLTAARESLQKLISNRSPEVASAAMDALRAIGVGESADAIAAALEKRRGTSELKFRIAALDTLASSGTEDALEVIMKFVRGRDLEMRTVAIGSLALFKNHSRATRALLEGLNDPEPSVRAAVLRAVREKREKPVVSALVDYLGKETEHRLKVDALKILVRLTGQNMGLVAADWKKWWDFAEERFEFPKKNDKAFTSVTAYDLEYFGIEISSKKLSFLADISSSMTRTVAVRYRPEEEDRGDGGTTGNGGRTRVKKKPRGGDGKDGGKGGGGKGNARKIDVLKRELQRVIRKLTPDTRINIVTFDATPRAWQKKLQPLAGLGRGKALSYVKNINTGHGTNVFDTLEIALKDKRVDTVYLLTDGVPTRGKITDPDAIIRRVDTLNRVRNITIHCIAFGKESDFLKRLAAANGGEYRFVNEY